MGKGRTPCCDKTGLKKGPWTPLEDQKLISFIETHGHNNWRALPKQAGLLRCGKSCRLRWINYLRPDIKRGNFTREEEETIIRLHESLGNKWSFIASHLPGRTDNEIKNVWNTHLKKRVPSKVTYPAKDKSTISSISTSSPSSTSTSSSTSNNSMLSHSIYSTDDQKIEVKEELAHTQQESMEKEASVQPLINSDSRISDSTGNIGSKKGMVVQSSTWMVPSKSTNPSLEDAREVVSSPNSCSTCSSSYISHLEQLVVEGSAKSVQDLAPDQHQQFNKSDNTPFELIDLDPFGEIVEIPFEPDILDMLDDELCFLPSTNVDPLPGTGGIHQQKQQQQMGSGEVSKEVESRNWVSYLENELGLQETDENHEQKRMSVTVGKGFDTQESTTGPFIGEDKILMETEIDPVSMYFEMWPSSPCRL